MSSSRPWLAEVRALWLAPSPAIEFGKLRREPRRRGGGVGVLAAERVTIRPGAVRVVERELAEHARAQHRDVLPALARGRRDRAEIQQRSDEDLLAARRRGRRAAAVPFVVERMSVSAAGCPTNSRGELPKSNPSMCSRLPLAADDRVGAFARREVRAPPRSRRSRARAR